MIPWLVLLQATLAISVAGPATSPEYLPLHVALAEGYFADQKVDVRIETARAGPLAAQALARGHAALAATSLDAALSLGHSGGTPPRLVYGLTAAPPVVLLAPPGSPIHALRDLIGKTVGIPAPGTPEDVALGLLLARAAVRANQVTVESFGERGLVGALESGAVAAAVMADPWATRLIEEGKATAVVDLREPREAARWLGEPTVHAALFIGADAKESPTDLTAVCRALLRAIEQIRTASAEELEARLPRAVTGTADDFALRLRGARDSYLRDGWVTTDMLAATLRLIRIRASIPARVDIPFRLSKLLLPRPLEEALGRRP